MTTTCPKTVVGGKQGHAPCKISLLQESLFLASVEFYGGHKTEVNLATHILLYITGFNIAVCVYLSHLTCPRKCNENVKYSMAFSK